MRLLNAPVSAVVESTNITERFVVGGQLGRCDLVTRTTIGDGLVVQLAGNLNDLAYAWSAPSGEFSPPSFPNTTFTCTASGTVVVKLIVSDGPVPAGQSCPSALSTTTLVVTCDEPLDASTGG